MLGAMRVIGLMSGTSADGIDAALVEWPDDAAARPFRLLAHVDTPFEPELQARIHRLAAGRVPAADSLRELGALDVALGERFAEAARGAAAAAGIPLASVDAIGSHGQTVGHYPELRATLQIGDPSVIAERTGCSVVADFRPRDVAAGGEGAPLAPFFHWAALGDPAEARLVLNLGGIANVTWLPRGGRAEDVIAFDTGPANSLMDGVVATLTQGAERFDRDAARARRGRVNEALLAELLADAFLARRPPKSTGRERYGLAEAEALAARFAGAPDDLVATLVEFTAAAVGRAARDFLGGAPERVLVGGGGARNPALMAALSRQLPSARVEPTEAAGVSSAALEAMAFSLLARNALLGLPNHLPQCTGASAARVLGELAIGNTARARGLLRLARG
ncbi:MAG TPA: anhydro-N-acetylmuramic acid kinase [Myxococcota bacterium]|jgi:anhydro-N-acetylmuramic acid kinase